jgi:hypothetical protein
MQQNTWRHQTFCYMIQHYNAHFKIVRLQKPKTSIKKKKIPKNFSDPIKTRTTLAKEKCQGSEIKMSACQKWKMLGKKSKTTNNTIHRN